MTLTSEQITQLAQDYELAESNYRNIQNPYWLGRYEQLQNLNNLLDFLSVYRATNARTGME